MLVIETAAAGYRVPRIVRSSVSGRVSLIVAPTPCALPLGRMRMSRRPELLAER